MAYHAMLTCAKHEVEKPNSPVQLNELALRRVAKQVSEAYKNGELGLPSWSWALPADVIAADYATQLFYFMGLSAINYCYWSREENEGAGISVKRWTYVDPYTGKPVLDHKGGVQQGANGMTAMLKDWYDNGIFPGVHLSPEGVKKHLGRYIKDMPLADKRMAALVELARIYPVFVGEDWPNTVMGLAYYNAPDYSLSYWKLTAQDAYLLAEKLPTFKDYFLKRAQLALGMFGCFRASQGDRVIFELTAYADYRVPQVLAHLGCIVYSDELQRKIDNFALIEKGSDEELAIRHATIAACNRIAQLANKEMTTDPITDVLIDAHLWLMSRDPVFEAETAPFHLTETTDY